MQEESEEDRRTTRHSAAVTKAALQPLHPNGLLHVRATDGTGRSHQKGHMLWLANAFSLPDNQNGDRLLFKHW